MEEEEGRGATRQGEPAQGGSERRRRQRREAEAEKRERTPALQETRREAGEGRGQRAVMAAAWAQRREQGRRWKGGEGGRGQWRTVPSAAPVKSAAGVAATAVMWWEGGDGDQSAATEWHFMGGEIGRAHV